MSVSSSYVVFVHVQQKTRGLGMFLTFFLHKGWKRFTFVIGKSITLQFLLTNL